MSDIPIIPKWMYILLWLVKPQYSIDIEGDLTTKTTYKVMFGKVFLLDIEQTI